MNRSIPRIYPEDLTHFELTNFQQRPLVVAPVQQLGVLEHWPQHLPAVFLLNLLLVSRL